MKFKKEYVNPESVCVNMMGIALPEHITINPNLTKKTGAQYEIIRGSSHDGTLLFTCQLLAKCMEPVVNKKSYWKGQNLEGVKDVKYEIGVISMATVFGRVKVPAGEINGERQRVRMAVKCTLIY